MHGQDERVELGARYAKHAGRPGHGLARRVLLTMEITEIWVLWSSFPAAAGFLRLASRR